MPNKRITDLAALATPAVGDKLAIVDVSDTTDSPEGTTKYVEVEDLVATPGAHATSHQNGGSDEINVAGLSGVLADPQVADKVKESSGPTTLTVGAVVDGEFLKRSGSTIVSDSVAAGPATQIEETSGPTVLDIGDIVDGEFLKRVGGEIVSDTAGAPTLDVDDISDPVFAADAGANDTYTATLSPAPGAYKTGVHYRFKANTANTGACSINFNGLGAKTIKKVAGGITTDLADNDIRAGQWVDLVYDGTNMQMQSTLGNAAGAGTTINASDTYLPRRSNSTTFANSFLSHDATNSQTNSEGHINLNNNTSRMIGWGNVNSVISFGALMSAGTGAVKVVANSTGVPGAFLSEFVAPPEPGGNPTPWSSVGMNFRRVLAGNITIGNPGQTGGNGTAIDGYRFILMLVQDATGSRTASWGSDYRFIGGVTPVLTTTANAVDIFEFICYSDIAYEIGRSMDVK